MVENVFWNWQFVSKFLAVLRQNIVVVRHLFFHAFYYVLGVVFQKMVADSLPFFSRKIVRYERPKDMGKFFII